MEYRLRPTGSHLEAFFLLIDIGVNLTNRQFDADRDAVIERALQSDVGHMIVTGTSVQVSRAALKLAQERPNILSSTAGVHPHDASEFNDATIDELRQIAANPSVVAIGECGLDHNRDFSPRDAQARAFDAQLALAAELQRPVFMHQRDAHEAFMEILSPRRPQISRGVVHCFTGTRKELADYLDLGLFIGVTGWICDERRGAELREAVRDIPLDRILVETDAPYLLPRDLSPKPKSRRNEPLHLPHIVTAVADCMGVSSRTLIAQSTANAHSFFGLNQPADQGSK